MRFALVLHGPEVLDTGLAQMVMALLRTKGQVTVVMSGYTGIAAVIDAGLEGEVDISRRRKPSAELARLDTDADILVLVNSAKNRESALRFGSIVFSRCKGKLTKPLFQIDDGILIDWTGHGNELAGFLKEKLGLEEVTAPMMADGGVNEVGHRRIGGVLPGESVWINGVVVGRATSAEVMIGKGVDGRLVAKGIVLKETGVRRLGEFDITKAHVRSGQTRRTSAYPRSIEYAKKGIYLIDHAAEESIYRCRHASLVVTVGDDTSKIAGALLYRFSVPVVAITDGDEDGISQDDVKARGSVIVRVRPGTDDLVGSDVRNAMFHGKKHLGGIATIREIAEEVIKLAGDRFISCAVID